MKAFLPHLIAWQKERGYPFEFMTEASINLADDDALLALMWEANFFIVFVGIESPDTDTLVSMQKKQNTRRTLAPNVHKIYRAGILVVAGFILGFDSEKGAVADGLIECIEATSIPVCMIGLLLCCQKPSSRVATRAKGDYTRPPIRCDGRPNWVQATSAPAGSISIQCDVGAISSWTTREFSSASMTLPPSTPGCGRLRRCWIVPGSTRAPARIPQAGRFSGSDARSRHVMADRLALGRATAERAMAFRQAPL